MSTSMSVGTDTMRAFRFLGPQHPPAWQEVGVPRPGPGEVLVRIAGAGLCRSDLEIFRGHYGLEETFTLGHENAGHIAAIGPDVDEWAVDQAVVVTCMGSCGVCLNCRRGRDNYCSDIRGRGVGLDGGLAPFMIAPARHLVPLRGLDPVHAAPLADAGLTSFHAVRSGVERVGPDASVLIMGVGGLGHLAVQFARTLTTGAVIAVDTDATRLMAARSVGADHTIEADEDVARVATDLVGEVDVIVDFVGTDSTMTTAAAVGATGGAVVLVGLGGGRVPFGDGTSRPGLTFVRSRGGSMHDLEQVVALARSGDVEVAVQRFTPDAVEDAYARLADGSLSGRAVVTF